MGNQLSEDQLDHIARKANHAQRSYVNSAELRDRVLALPRPLPQDATYLIELELDDLLAFVEQEIRAARLDEREKIMLDLGFGRTYSEHTDWRAEFARAIRANGRRIAELEKEAGDAS